MGELIVVDKTMIMWDTSGFLPVVITPIPGIISASNATKGKAAKLPICVEGDEKSVQAMGCMYMDPAKYPIPGVGVLKIKKLSADNFAKKVKLEGKKVIIAGKPFDAVFEVMAPAMQLPPPAMGGAPDGTPKYQGGKGNFLVLANMMVKAG